MGCGNSTATSAAAGRGKRGCGAWVPRERQRQRGARSSLGPSSISSLELACFWKDREKAGAPVRGRSRPDSAGRTVVWSCSRSLHPSGEQKFPDVSLVPYIPFPLACIQASPGTPWLPDPEPGKVLLSKSGLFWGWGRVPVCWGQQPAGLGNRIRVGLLT